MFAATRRWFRRNRTPIAVGLGAIGAGYVVTQYVLNKLNDARERMSSDRVAKENLRRRFQQNQEDCTYTVLALLPTAATKILETLDVEKITLEIQQMKGGTSRGTKSDTLSLPETTTGFTDEDGQSMVSTSESGVHASQITVPPASQTLDGAEQQQTTQPERPRKTKRQLWGDVTISSITRAFTFIYTLALLTLLTRIQLNLLGRRSYLSSVVSLATGSSTGAPISLENKDDDNTATDAYYGDEFEVNRKYLTFSWWLLNRGWTDVMKRVEAAVREVFGQMSPRDQLSYEQFRQMTAQVRRLVEGGGVLKEDGVARPHYQPGATDAQWLRFLLPPPEMEDYVLRESGILDDSATFATQQGVNTATTTEPTSSTSSSSLRRLLDETSDLIETPTFSHVLTQTLDAGFAILLEQKLAPGAFSLDPSTLSANASSSTLTPSEPPASQFLVVRDDLTASITSSPAALATTKSWEKKVLLPKCLSILTRQAHAIGDAMPTNEYLSAMEKVHDLEGFAAVVYSSNWENEIREQETAGLVNNPPTSTSSSIGDRGGGDDERPGTATTAATNSVRQSQHLLGGVEESAVLVDPSHSSFESVWAKVTTET